MNDPLEEALERMKPAEMPNHLMARLTAARPQSPPAKAAPAGWMNLVRRWLVPLAAAGATALVTITVLRQDPPSTVPPPFVKNEAVRPYERNDVLIGLRDGGVMVAPDQKPYRVMEIEWQEEDTMRPNADGSGIRVETKRRAVVPVPLEVF